MPLPRSSVRRLSLLSTLSVSIVFAVPSGIGKPGVSLPLPKWEEAEASENSLLSASLFPEGGPAAGAPATGFSPGSPPIPPPPIRDPNAPFQPFLEPLDLQPLVNLDNGEKPESEDMPPAPTQIEIPLEDFQVYRAKPENYLVNPQHLLSEPQEFDLTEFLDYHAGESGIPIYLLVVDGDQKMPERFDLSGHVDLWFPSEPVCVVLYYLGYPSRSEVALSPPLREVAGSVSGIEILEHAAADAYVASDPIDQLSRFSVRTSIRMFWLEKRLRDPGALAAESTESTTFSEVLATVGRLFKSTHFYAAIFGLIALAAAFYVIRSLWLARTGGRVYVFPDFEFAPRLGAPHSGGSDYVIDFEPRD